MTDTCVSPSDSQSTKITRSPSIKIEEVRKSLDGVQEWVERCEYRGYEPFDGLSSWARPLTFGNLLAKRILMQTIRQCPINLRFIMGVRPKDSTKGRGYMAWGYLALYRATQHAQYLEKAVDCLKWLDQHKAPAFADHSWSNHYDFVGRGGFYSRHDPIIVWTCLIGQAYVEAFDVTGDKWCLGFAESACKWIMKLPRERTDQGDCLSY